MTTDDLPAWATERAVEILGDLIDFEPIEPDIDLIARALVEVAEREYERGYRQSIEDRAALERYR